jgi:molybdopterin synthase catalytic subunit
MRPGDAPLIRVQAEDIDVAGAIEALGSGGHGVGALALFIGLVRDLSDGRPVDWLTLEHFPGMTEKVLAEVDAAARERWLLQATTIIHRFGRLAPGDRIVLVAVASAHRDAAFEACRFIVDQLKSNAPFWKLEEGAGERHWVAARAEDNVSAEGWHRRETS